ncbi:MAG: MFS transporter [Actinomycetota bacterium]
MHRGVEGLGGTSRNIDVRGAGGTGVPLALRGRDHIVRGRAGAGDRPGWLAIELGDSNAARGGVYMAFGIPMLVAIPFGGVLADRISKRSILLGSQVGLVSTSAWLGFGVLFEFVEYWMLLATAAVQAIAFAFLGPARVAMTSEFVGRRLLTNAVVLAQMSLSSTRVVAPALAGIGIGVAWFGVAGVYLSSAALLLCALVALLPLPQGKPREAIARRSPGREFCDAIAYVRRNSEVGVLLLTSFVVVMIGFPYLAFLPRLATEVHTIGAGGYGALSAASAVGAVAMSFWAAGRGSRRSPWRIEAATGMLYGVAILALALAPTVPTALLAIAGLGAGASGFQAMNNSLALNLADFEYHGRIQSLTMLSFSGFGMAALPLGTLADSIGLRPTLAIMGVAVIVAMCASMVALRDRRTEHPQPSETPALDVLTLDP